MLLELCAAAGPGRASGVRSLATAHLASCIWRADTSAPKGSGTAPLEWLVLGATCAYTCACACDPTRTTCIRRLDRNLFSGYFAALSLSHTHTHTHTLHSSSFQLHPLAPSRRTHRRPLLGARRARLALATRTSPPRSPTTSLLRCRCAHRSITVHISTFPIHQFCRVVRRSIRSTFDTTFTTPLHT